LRIGFKLQEPIPTVIFLLYLERLKLMILLTMARFKTGPGCGALKQAFFAAVGLRLGADGLLGRSSLPGI